MLLMRPIPKDDAFIRILFIEARAEEISLYYTPQLLTILLRVDMMNENFYVAFAES